MDDNPFIRYSSIPDAEYYMRYVKMLLAIRNFIYAMMCSVYVPFEVKRELCRSARENRMELEKYWDILIEKGCGFIPTSRAPEIKGMPERIREIEDLSNNSHIDSFKLNYPQEGDALWRS